MRTMHAILSLFVLTLFCAAPAVATVYHEYYGSYGGDTWTTWEEDYLDNNKSHATPPYHPTPSFGGCYIADRKGNLLEDLDCDKVVDIVDNCLGVQNPDQFDQNTNGLGDGCDLIVEKILLDPEVVMEGRAFIITTIFTNYRAYDLRNLELRVQVPELGLEQIQYVDIIRAGQQLRYEFFLRVPECTVKKNYDVVLFLEWPKMPGLKESFYIPTTIAVTSSGLCQEEPTMQGKSLINILDIQDIDPVDGGDYPFTIVNNEGDDKAYVITVQGTEEWGSFEVKPRSMIVVPAGESRQGVITIYANKGATGEHGFVVTLRSNSDADQETLTARIKQQRPGMNRRALLQLVLFVIAAILVLLAVAYFIHRSQSPQNE